MSKTLVELAAEIVQCLLAAKQMSARQVESALTIIYNTLCRIHRADQAGELVGDMIPAAQGDASAGRGTAVGISPSQSIQEHKVICLECGAAFRQLTANHLRIHQLTPREYKKKYGFPLKQPLSAKSLTAMRSREAKKRGLPKNLRKYQEERRKKRFANEFR